MRLTFLPETTSPNYFSDTDARVDYLFSGRPREKFFDMDCFGDFRVVDGLTFVTADGKIDYLQTILTSRHSTIP